MLVSKTQKEERYVRGQAHRFESQFESLKNENEKSCASS